ncbi:MAG: flagellar biosynthetic protein FliR [Desulfobacteraceae bacterium]|nr:flagellar biosynthetic protein FliR [Desulfobacteraceae bacterium]
MPDTALLNWTLDQVLTLLVIMTRVGPMVFMMPVIGSSSVPAQVKALFALVLSLILLPVVPAAASQLPTSAVGYGLFVVQEVAFGATLGFFARLIFDATDLAGQMVSIAMGMGMAGTIDPDNGTQVSLVGTLWNIVAILLFLAMNGHYAFFRLLAESFTLVKPGGMVLGQATIRGLTAGLSQMFALGIQIMAPTAIALFLSHVAMGIVAKTVPQVPVMLVAMPLNIGAGLLFVGLSMIYLLPLLGKNFDLMTQALVKLAAGMRG